MKPERAEEIRLLGNRYCNWSKFCTPEENAYIKKIWDHMPGHTCWFDALMRVVKNNIGEIK